MSAHLIPGDEFPAIAAKDLEGNVVPDIAAAARGKWAMVQFYRGNW